MVQPKGGCGKSTLAWCLAHAAATPGPVVLVDLDAQGTLLDWAEARGRRPGPAVVAADAETAERVLGGLPGRYGTIILDVPGESRAGYLTRFAAALADVALVPLRPTAADEGALARNLLPMMRAMRERPPFAVVPVGVHPRARRDNVLTYYDALLPDDLAVVPAPVAWRTVYGAHTYDGLSLAEYGAAARDRRTKKAAVAAVAEIEALAGEVAAWI